MSDRLVEGRNKIMPVLIDFIRACYQMHIVNRIEDRNEILTFIDMCVESLLELECNPQEIENVIVSLGFRAFPHDFITIEWYIDRIIPGFDEYEQLNLLDEEESTCNDSSFE